MNDKGPIFYGDLELFMERLVDILFILNFTTVELCFEEIARLYGESLDRQKLFEEYRDLFLKNKEAFLSQKYPGPYSERPGSPNDEKPQ